MLLVRDWRIFPPNAVPFGSGCLVLVCPTDASPAVHPPAGGLARVSLLPNSPGFELHPLPEGEVHPAVEWPAGPDAVAIHIRLSSVRGSCV